MTSEQLVSHHPHITLETTLQQQRPKVNPPVCSEKAAVTAARSTWGLG